jgi:hypothetical protein
MFDGGVLISIEGPLSLSVGLSVVSGTVPLFSKVEAGGWSVVVGWDGR